MLAKFENGIVKFAYGKLLKHGDTVVVNPREEDWLEVGYKPVVGERLENKEGFYQVPEYSEEGDKIVVTYHYEELVDEQESDA